MSTFAELGIPFPLFEGPVDTASEYVGAGNCYSCGEHRRHCFELGIGAGLILNCPQCGTENGLDADDREGVPCRSCGSLVPFPSGLDEEILACYECVRAGHAALTKDTRYGMVSWEQAFEGVTHGVPGLVTTDFEMVPLDDGWVGARIPSDLLFELLRTPTYTSIQGDQWEFCCKHPMVYVGTWTQDDFNTAAESGDGRALFQHVVQDPVDGLWEDELHDVTGIYVFRCQHCDRLTANWDIA